MPCVLPKHSFWQPPENIIVHNIGGDGPGNGKGRDDLIAGGITDDLTTYGDN